MLQRLLKYCEVTIVLFFIFMGHSMGQSIIRCAHTPPAIKFPRQLPTAYQLSTLINSTDTIIIPVVVHVIHNNNAGVIGGVNNPNITDAQIYSQIDVLNNDFMRLNADTNNTPNSYTGIAGKARIQFCLATTDPNGNATTGINRIYNPKSFYQITDNNLLKSLSYWPSSDYLNIWVCNLRGPTSITLLLGYATVPGGGLPGLEVNDPPATDDGVVINYRTFGTTGPLIPEFNLGRTTTHEVGHWLGLFHTWGAFDLASCSETDYCDDTPFCSGRFTSSVSAGCPSPTDCSEPRMIQNYMDYSMDACTNLFTVDQIERMRSVFGTTSRRSLLLNSIGCCTINGVTVSIPEKSFEDQSLTSGTWEFFNGNGTSSFTPGFQVHPDGAYQQSNYSLVGNNDSIYTSTLPNSNYYYTYTSPFFRLNTIQGPTLRFDWAYTLQQSMGTSDSIVISYSKGCSNDWIPLRTYYGSSFYSTINYRNSFTPSADEWQTESLSLQSLTQAAAARIRWEVYSKGINPYYLDNIRIDASSPSLDAILYPVPTENNISIQTTYTGKKVISYRIYNGVGQLVWERSDPIDYSHTTSVSLDLWSSGVYFIQVSDDQTTKTIKFIKL
ncbi:MAG: M43 family zinc metalloprotease [Cytophagaceae bacterium]|jgi:hypothetical protein|nr:M43 family zinc metalloprotease [Cytophagaceae bacterium]